MKRATGGANDRLKLTCMAAAVVAMIAGFAQAGFSQTPSVERVKRTVLVSIPDRKLAVIEDGDVIATFAVAVGADDIGGFGEVVFDGDGLECCVGEKAIEGHYRGRIAREAAGGEGVNLVDGGAHKKILAEA